jgi:hypothetical protein
LFELLHQATPAATLARNLAQIERVTAAAERDGLTEHALRLRKHCDLLQRARKAGALDAAIVEAMNLAAAWERLRADALLAGDVASYRRSHKRAVSDDQIRAAVSSTRTQAEAAAVLGISARRLSTHEGRLGIRRNRKPPTSDADK